MKLLILVTAVMISMSVTSQTRDTSNTANLQFHLADSLDTVGSSAIFISSGPWCMTYLARKRNGKEGQISFCSDSTMKVEGDTGMAVANMMAYINSMQERFYAAQGVLDRINLNELAKIVNLKDFTAAVRKYQKSEADEEKRLNQLRKDLDK